MTPFSKTGGLADVSSSLPAALAARGHEVTVITPRYRSVDRAGVPLLRRRGRITVPVQGRSVSGQLVEARLPGPVLVLLVEQPDFFDRAGLYGEDGRDYPDNAERFAFFSRAVLEAATAAGLQPQVIHLNDWQTGPVAAFLQAEYRDRSGLKATGTVMTIHNLGYAGAFEPQAVLTLGLSWDLFTPSGLEFFGKASYLKAGLVFADKLTTVSRTYAREIQTQAFGCGFDGLLRERAADLQGILNGVDYTHWDPRHDRYLPANYSAEDPSGKATCKAELQRTLGLQPQPQTPLVGAISRLSGQKGFDLLLQAADSLLQLPLQWVVLGVGERELEEGFAELARRAPGRFAFRCAQDEALAHQIQAGCDMLLMPSRYEPCGLNQLYALRYGTLPVVRAVGGLDETIEEAADGEGHGFKFRGDSPADLLAALKRALQAYSDGETWRRMMQTAMELDFSWDRPARQYEIVYRKVMALRSEK